MPKTLRTLTSGEMRHIGDLEKLVVGTDATGAPRTDYEIFAKDIRFGIDDWKPYETWAANAPESALSTRLRIRYRPGLDGIAPSTMRIKRRTSDAGVSPVVFEYYDIIGAVRDPTTRVDLTLWCMRRDAAGFKIGTKEA